MSFRNYVTIANPGRRIPVVHLLWEQADWVQFPAARKLLIVRKYRDVLVDQGVR